MQSTVFHMAQLRFSQKAVLWLLCANVTLAADVGANATAQNTTNNHEAIGQQVLFEVTNAIQAGTEQLMRLLTQPIPKSMAMPLGAEAKEVDHGRSLPSFFHNQRLPGRDYDDILEGTLFGATEDEFRLSHRWLMTIPELVKKDSVEFMDWLESRSRHLPPNAADLLVAVALDSCEWDRRGEEFWNVNRNKWRRMLRARNPVYRLTAIENLNRFETNSLRKIEACDAALRETNTIFQFWALEVLQEVRGPAGAKTIEDFMSRAPRTNDGTLSLEFDIVDLAQGALVKSRSRP